MKHFNVFSIYVDQLKSISLAVVSVAFDAFNLLIIYELEYVRPSIYNRHIYDALKKRRLVDTYMINYDPIFSWTYTKIAHPCFRFAQRSNQMFFVERANLVNIIYFLNIIFSFFYEAIFMFPRKHKNNINICTSCFIRMMMVSNWHHHHGHVNLFAYNILILHN